MTTSFTYSITPGELRRTRYSQIPDKPFMVKKGKRVLPVFELQGSIYSEIETEAKLTTVDWKFLGSHAYILPSYMWRSLHQKRRCKAVFIPLEKAVPEPHRLGQLVGFVAASVDVFEVSITSGAPIPKKPKKKNTKSSNLGYTAGNPTMIKNIGHFTPQVPTHINTVTRKSDGFVVYSTDTTKKQIKTILKYGSSSTPGLQYNTIVYKDGSVSCNCPAWTKKVPRSCKHIVHDRTVTEIKR